MTAKKSCKYGEYGLIEHLLLLCVTLSTVMALMRLRTDTGMLLSLYWWLCMHTQVNVADYQYMHVCVYMHACVCERGWGGGGGRGRDGGGGGRWYSVCVLHIVYGCYEMPHGLALERCYKLLQH